MSRLVPLLLLCIAAYTFASSDSSVLLVDKHQVGKELTQIDESSIADYVSAALGGPVVNAAAPRTAIPMSRGVFERAQANLLIVLDNVASHELSVAARDALTALPSSQLVQLESASGKHSLSTLVSGGAKQSFVDLLSQQSHGRSLSIAASADHTTAGLLAARQVTVRKSNDLAFFWHGQQHRFTSLYQSPSYLGKPLTCNGHTAAQTLLHAQLSGVSVHFTATDFTATTASGLSATFSLHDSVDMELLAELAFLLRLAPVLRSPGFANLTADHLPDTFSIAVSALHRLADEPVKFAVAQQLTVACLAQTVAEVAKVYDDQLVAEVVLLAPAPLARLARRQAVADTSNITTLDPQMVNFQLSLWTAIVLILTTMAVVYLMCSLGSGDGSSDSMLYRGSK